MSNEPPATPVVLCVKWGGKYGPDYVNRLFSMVRRNLSLPHDFACLTDEAGGIDPRIQILPMDPAGLEFCWTKLQIFSERVVPAGRLVLYLDLDVVVTGRLEELFAYRPALDFLSVLDWNRRWVPQFNSSVMRFRSGTHRRILEDFHAEVEAGRLVKKREWDACLRARDKVVYWNGLRRFGGDQEWISRRMGAGGKLGELCYPAPWILSYKKGCRKRIPEGCRVMVFHGEPKPHEVTDQHVIECWK